MDKTIILVRKSQNCLIKDGIQKLTFLFYKYCYVSYNILKIQVKDFQFSPIHYFKIYQRPIIHKAPRKYKNVVEEIRKTPTTIIKDLKEK